jgi:hypothetical protein
MVVFSENRPLDMIQIYQQYNTLSSLGFTPGNL